MPTLVVSITLFVLALLIGIEVIGKVPATLHTPLMSGANSIHGIVIVGVVINGCNLCLYLHDRYFLPARPHICLKFRP